MNELVYRIRPVNIVIIVATQLFFLYGILFPYLEFKGISPSPEFHYWLIIVVTAIVCIAGYVINDIFDRKIDLINKPEKAITNIVLWKIVYFGLLFVGGGIILFLSQWYDHNAFIAIYLLANYLLFLYSWKMKCLPLIGNIIVAIFSALVIAALFGPDYKEIFAIPIDNSTQLVRPFSYYFLFAFLISLIREIIKDMEDIDGDNTFHCNTLVKYIGIKYTAIVAVIFSLVLLVSLLVWQLLYWMFYPIWSLVLLNIMVSLPFLFIIYKLIRFHINGGKNTTSVQLVFSSISQQLKWIMIVGILFLLVEVFWGFV